MRRPELLFPSLLAFLSLSGCADKDHLADLRRLPDASDAQNQVEPAHLPQLEPLQFATYDVADRRSPFTKPQMMARQQHELVGARPEDLPVTANRQAAGSGHPEITGTLSRKGVCYALVRTGSGRIHRVAFGDLGDLSQHQIKLAGEACMDSVEAFSGRADVGTWKAVSGLQAGDTATHTKGSHGDS